MKKLTVTAAIILLILSVTGAVIYNTPAGQDAIFSRAAEAVMSQRAEPVEGLRVVVCGSASPLGNDPARAQACIAVVTPEHFFLFDVGARSPLRISQAQLPMGRISAVFLTHYHSDHIAALPDVNLTSWVQGRPGPLQVYGPSGVQKVVAGFNTAYELDRGYRTAHHGAELLPPERSHMQANEFSADGVIFQDDKVTVTAFTVEHPPIDPAVGYRVDYAGRSVVISGDSNASENLFEFARDADLVLHDALSRTLLDQMIDVATELNVPRMPIIMTDVIDYHADASSLADAAREAGVRQLAFYHMVPVPGNALAEKMFTRGLDDDIIVTRDLQTFDLPPNSTEIIISEP